MAGPLGFASRTVVARQRVLYHLDPLSGVERVALEAVVLSAACTVDVARRLSGEDWHGDLAAKLDALVAAADDKKSRWS
jgi:hypothetical protein